jgi:hypothetical protein
MGITMLQPDFFRAEVVVVAALAPRRSVLVLDRIGREKQNLRKLVRSLATGRVDHVAALS